MIELKTNKQKCVCILIIMEGRANAQSRRNKQNQVGVNVYFPNKREALLYRFKAMFGIIKIWDRCIKCWNVQDPPSDLMKKYKNTKKSKTNPKTNFRDTWSI